MKDIKDVNTRNNRSNSELSSSIPSARTSFRESIRHKTPDTASGKKKEVKKTSNVNNSSISESDTSAIIQDPQIIIYKEYRYSELMLATENDEVSDFHIDKFGNEVQFCFGKYASP